MKKILLAVFLIVFFVSIISSQPELLSRKNYGINWYHYNTENFKIIYNKKVEASALKAGRLAEEIYSKQSEKLGLKFKKRYKIYISNIDDIPNGFTTPFNYIYIWADVSNYSTILTGYDKWLKSVLAHEMVHALIMENIKGWVDFFFPGSILALPREINEGFAQFYGNENWGAERGDIYLNLAVKNNDLSHSVETIDRGKLLYAKGFSKIKYLNMEYPDFKSTKLFKYRDFFGFFNWEKSFNKNFPISYKTFCNNWEKYMNVYYNWREGLSERSAELGTKIKNIEAVYIKSIKKNPGAEGFAFIGKKSKNSSDNRLYYFNQKFKKIKYLDSGGLTGDLNFNKSGTKIYFTKRHYTSKKAISTDIFSVDLKTKSIEQTTLDCKASNPVIVNDDLIFSKNNKGTMNLYNLNLKNKKLKKITDFNNKFQIFDININYKFSKITFSFLDPDIKKFGFCIFNYQNGKLTKIFTENKIRYPLIFPDNENKILLTVFENNLRVNLFSYNLENGKHRRITNQSNFLKAMDFDSTDGKILTIVQESRNKNEIFAVDKNRIPKNYPGKIREYYKKWLEIKTGYSFNNRNLKTRREQNKRYNHALHINKKLILPYPFNIENKLSGGFVGYFSDDIGKNTIITYLGYNHKDPINSNYGINFIYRNYFFDIKAGFNYLDFQNSDYLNKELMERNESYRFEISIPIYDNKSFFNKSEWGLGFVDDKNIVINRDIYNDGLANNSTINLQNLPEGYNARKLFFKYYSRKGTFYKNFPDNRFDFFIKIDLSNSFFGSDYNYEKINLSTDNIIGVNDKYSIRLNFNFEMLSGEIAPQNRLGLKYKKSNSSIDLFSGYLYTSEPTLRGLEHNIFNDKTLVQKLEIRNIINKSIMGLLFIDSGAVWDKNDYEILNYIGIEFKFNFNIYKLAAGISRRTDKLDEGYNYYWYIEPRKYLINMFKNIGG